MATGELSANQIKAIYSMKVDTEVGVFEEEQRRINEYRLQVERNILQARIEQEMRQKRYEECECLSQESPLSSPAQNSAFRKDLSELRELIAIIRENHAHRADRKDVIIRLVNAMFAPVEIEKDRVDPILADDANPESGTW